MGPHHLRSSLRLIDIIAPGGKSRQAGVRGDERRPLSSPRQKIPNHRGTEAGQRESPGASPMGNLIGMLFFISMQECSVILSSVFSVPLW